MDFIWFLVIGGAGFRLPVASKVPTYHTQFNGIGVGNAADVIGDLGANGSFGTIPTTNRAIDASSVADFVFVVGDSGSGDGDVQSGGGRGSCGFARSGGCGSCGIDDDRFGIPDGT